MAMLTESDMNKKPAKYVHDAYVCVYIDKHTNYIVVIHTDNLCKVYVKTICMHIVVRVYRCIVLEHEKTLFST